jgi:hypothetical protein
MMRLVARAVASVFVLNFAIAACATMQGPSKPQPKQEEDKEAPDEGDDEGVKNINKQLRKFNSALGQKRFDEAASFLRKAQLQVQKATEVTKSNPEFEDVQDAVTAAEKRYTVAVEQDRIERRNAAIDDLIKRGNVALSKADQLQQQLQDKVPSEQDVAALRGVLQELADIRVNGSQYHDDQVYADHAKMRDQKTRELATREAVAQWQIDASTAINTSVEAARQAIVAGQKAPNADEQSTDYRKAAQAFATCLSTIQSLESKDYDIDPRLVNTALGAMSIINTRKECTERNQRLTLEVDKLAWRGRVLQALGSLSQAIAKRDAAKTSADVSAGVDSTITALAACSAELEAGAKMRGADLKSAFESPYGNVPTPQIAKGCAKERDQLTRDRPVYIWRASAETLREPLGVARQKAQLAAASTKPDERLEMWTTVKANASACADQAAKLEAAKDADKRYPIQAQGGSMSIGRVHDECSQLSKTADAELKKANDQKSLEQFLTQLKNDELEVAKKEGIPQRIDTVQGGRVFVYEKNQYGFDTDGKRFDFKAARKQRVDTVVADIGALIAAIKNASSADAQLQATNAAIDGLAKCQGALPAVEKQPGFDPEKQFDTAIGKLYAVQIPKECGTYREKLQHETTPLQWKAALEKVRDRAAQAASQVAAGKAAATATERVQLLSTAMGGYRECSERAESLMNGAGSDPKLEITSPFGMVTRKKLGAECATALSKTQKDLDTAIADKRLEDFIATAKGDEKEVAKREGMPTRIDVKGAGRVFIYQSAAKAPKGKKADEKRFAFNAAGQRVTEDALK